MAELPVLPKERKCKSCGETKALNLFGWHPTCRDFHSPRCKDCAAKKRHRSMLKRLDTLRRLQAAEMGVDPDTGKPVE